ATSGTSSTSFNITVEEVASGCTGTDGLCRMSTVSDCAAAGGAFLGVDCAVGACCNGGACSTVAGGDCADGGGAYQGDGTVCDASANVTSAPNLPIPDNSPAGL